MIDSFVFFRVHTVLDRALPRRRRRFFRRCRRSLLLGGREQLFCRTRSVPVVHERNRLRDDRTAPVHLLGGSNESCDFDYGSVRRMPRHIHNSRARKLYFP